MLVKTDGRTTDIGYEVGEVNAYIPPKSRRDMLVYLCDYVLYEWGNSVWDIYVEKEVIEKDYDLNGTTRTTISGRFSTTEVFHPENDTPTEPINKDSKWFFKVVLDTHEEEGNDLRGYYRSGDYEGSDWKELW